MSDYQIRYGYLQTVKLADDINAVPLIKEDKTKLTEDETIFLLKELKKFRKMKDIYE